MKSILHLRQSGWRRTLGAACCALMLSVTAFAQDDAAAPTEPAVESAPAVPATLAAALTALPEADFSEKEALLRQLVALDRAKARPILQALLDGQLYQRSDDQRVFIVAESGDSYSLTDPETAQAAGTATADQMQKIGTNNQLRRMLKGLIAQLALGDEDAGARRDAVREMLRGLDATTVAALRAHQASETDPEVRDEIEVGLALADLDSSEADVRLAAVERLADELSPDVYNKLQPLSEKDEAGAYREPDERVRMAAAEGLRNIAFWREVYGSVETLFFGLSLGSVLVLAAIGLAITFGVMGVINMAHGELIMLGAYTTYVLQLLMPNHITLSLWLSIPAAFLVSGLVGVAIERGVCRFLYGRPLETLLATFGLSLVLQQLVRSIFSPLNRSVQTPEFMSGSLVINDALSLTYNRLYIVVFTLIVFAVLQLVLKRTSLGLKVRAVSQNRAMARAMGVRSQWVDAATFGLGSGIAGIAGVALSQLTNVGPNLGQAYIIDSFMVVVFGGVGNLWGTLISGMSLGLINKLLEPWAGAVMAKILVLVFLILFIQRRPRGLFPQKGRAAES